MSQTEAMRAIDAARRALEWRVDIPQRRQWLEKLVNAIMSHRDEMARIITLENGKPLKESIAEVEYAAGFFAFYAEHLDVLQPRELDPTIKQSRWTVHHRPAGVAGLISPWNFPIAMLAKKLAAAIGGGCPLVAKPAEQTPLTAIAFWTLCQEIEFPPGWMNLLIGDAEGIGAALFAHPAVRIVSFTGSTEVGRILIHNSAAGLKRLTMELGGSAPFIVFDDADLDKAVDGLMVSKFRSAGQTCVCANRVYVHHSIIEAFSRRVVERVRKLRLGDGMDPQTDIGPLINRAGFEKVAAHVRDAMAQGASRLAGDDPPPPREDWGAFYPPTVLLGMKPEMLVSREETFGPVIAIAEFDGEAEAISAANATPYGLAAYFFSEDPGRRDRVAAALRFGHVGINTGIGPTPQAPFGGMKQSGYGREGGIEGLLEFCEIQTVAESANESRSL